jgi:hypothetical protein
MSSMMPPGAMVWPPMLWRAPAMEIGNLSRRARAMRLTMSLSACATSEGIGHTSATSVGFRRLLSSTCRASKARCRSCRGSSNAPDESRAAPRKKSARQAGRARAAKRGVESASKRGSCKWAISGWRIAVAVNETQNGISSSKRIMTRFRRRLIRKPLEAVDEGIALPGQLTTTRWRASILAARSWGLQLVLARPDPSRLGKLFHPRSVSRACSALCRGEGHHL